jgi:hypothetical protein
MDDAAMPERQRKRPHRSSPPHATSCNSRPFHSGTSHAR